MDKLKVGDVAKTLGVDPQTVREWSSHFRDYLSADANPPHGATRYYTEDDLTALTFVYKLRRNDATFPEIDAALALDQHRLTMPNLIVKGDSPLSGLGSGTSIVKTGDVERYVRLEGQLEEVKGERDYLREALQDEQRAHNATRERAVKAETKLDTVKALPAPAAPAAPPFPKWLFPLVALALVLIVVLLAVVAFNGIG